MILGSGNPTPYDLHALVALCLLALVLLIGAVVGPNWVSGLAPLLRRGAALAALLIMAAVFFLTPTTNGIVGAGRLLTLWPAFAACIVFFLIWSWRSGRL
jgi:hypothetical protein